MVGGPARIKVLATYLYEKGIRTQSDYGIVSATAVVMLVVVQIVSGCRNTRWATSGATPRSAAAA